MWSPFSLGLVSVAIRFLLSGHRGKLSQDVPRADWTGERRTASKERRRKDEKRREGNRRTAEAAAAGTNSPSAHRLPALSLPSGEVARLARTCGWAGEVVSICQREGRRAGFPVSRGCVVAGA